MDVQIDMVDIKDNDGTWRMVECNHPPCEKCDKGLRLCVRGTTGVTCLPCRTMKTKCSYANPKTMKRARDEQGGNEVREAGPSKRKSAKRVEKQPPEPKVKCEVAQPKTKSTVAGKAKSLKAKGKAKAKEVSNEEEDEGMDVDNDEDKAPKAKRARWTYTDKGTSVVFTLFFLSFSFDNVLTSFLEIDKRFARLEAHVTEIKDDAKKVRRYGAQLTNLKGDYQRFAGTLDRFLSNIQIDDRLQLVPDTRRIKPRSEKSIDIEIEDRTGDLALLDPSVQPEFRMGMTEDDPVIIDIRDPMSSSPGEMVSRLSELVHDMRMEWPTGLRSPGPTDSEMAPHHRLHLHLSLPLLLLSFSSLRHQIHLRRGQHT